MTEADTGLSSDVGIFANHADVAPPPPADALPFREIEHTWYGTDGSVWTLSDPETGIFLTQEGIEGLHLPTVDYALRESPGIAGASYHGYRVKSRVVTWVLYIYSDESSEAFFDLDSRLWKSMRIGENGTWRVTRPNGDFRELTMRITPASEAFDRDPGQFGWKRYPVIFSADENPFWTVPYEVPGSRVSFEAGQGRDFFGDGAGAPEFYITPERIDSSREIVNAGDEDVWISLTVTGPMDAVDLSIGTRHYSLECDLLAGQWIRIDTNPRTFAVLDDRERDRLGDLSDWVFDPIPWGRTVPLSVITEGMGGGSVVLRADPLFHRAW